MTLKERLNLLLHRNECIHASIIMENRRKIDRIVRVPYNEGTFKLSKDSDERYVIDYDLATFDELGLPYFEYYYNNSKPIDFELSKADEYTSKEFETVFNNRIIEQINEANKKEVGITVDKLVLIFGIINVLGLVVIGYLVYTGFENLNEEFGSIKEFIELIRNILVTNGELT